MLHRFSLLLLLFCLSWFPWSDTAAQDTYDGTWRGRTDQAEQITLIIDNNTLQAVNVRVHIQGDEPDWCTGSVLFVGNNGTTGLYYLDNPFIDLSWEQDGVVIRLVATLYGNDAAGVVELTTTDNTAYPRSCLGFGRADWEARRGAPYDSGRPTQPTQAPPPPPPPAPPAPPSAPTSGPQQPRPTSPPVSGNLSGQGQTVTDPLLLPSTINRVRATHNGQSNFQLTAIATDGSQEYLLVNEIGTYQGTTLLLASGEHFFEINADGDWTLQIEAVPVNPQPQMALSGTGDAVSDLFTPDRTGAVPYRFTHDGESNFQVSLVCDGRLVDLAQNEIGVVDNEAVVSFPGSGLCLWEIAADGSWTVQPR